MLDGSIKSDNFKLYLYPGNPAAANRPVRCRWILNKTACISQNRIKIPGFRIRVKPRIRIDEMIEHNWEVS